MTGADISVTMTLRLNDDLNQRLDRLSKATGRTKSFLAAEAIREFVDFNERHIVEIEEAVAEADREELASEKQVRGVFARWGVGGG